MTPALPAELLSEILALATKDQSPPERQLTRGRFRLVCKGWNTSFEYWNEVEVTGADRLSRLAVFLAEAGPAHPPGSARPGQNSPRLSLRSATVDLASVSDRSPAEGREHLQAFLRLSPDLSKLDISTRLDGLSDPFGPGVRAALARLSGMRRFAWRGERAAVEDLIGIETEHVAS